MEEASGTGALQHAGPGRGEVLAAILIGGLGVTQVVAMPLLASLIAEAYGVPEINSGLVGLANLLGTAAGSLCVTIWLQRLPVRLTSIIAALLACLSQTGAALMPDFNGAVLMEALAGGGAGILLALSAAIVGASGNADRGFAFILTLQALIAVIVLLAIPALGGASALLPVGLFLAGMQLLLVPASLALRRKPFAAAEARETDEETSMFHPGVLLKAGSYFVFSAAVGVLWVFAGVLGSVAGLSDGSIGQALAVGNVAAIAGSLLAALITSRFGRVGPVLTVCLTVALSVLLFTDHMSVGHFYAASGLFLFAWGGGLPLMMGIVSEVDPTERVTSLLPVLAFAGMGVGPALVSLFPEAHDLFLRVSVSTLSLTILSFGLFIVAHLFWRRQLPEA
jgi:predicted MFS family arabinose efflux permease